MNETVPHFDELCELAPRLSAKVLSSRNEAALLQRFRYVFPTFGNTAPVAGRKKLHEALNVTAEDRIANEFEQIALGSADREHGFSPGRIWTRG